MYLTIYQLRNDLLVEILDYNESHAISISKNLFNGLDSDVIVQQRIELLSPGPEEVFSVSSLSDGQVIGVCTGVRKRWYGERHRIEIVQAVVKDDFHGLGIARYMMKEIAEHFSNYGVEILQISTESNNERALAAYERIGFERFGVLEKGLRFENIYSDEILLAINIEDLLSR